MVGWFLRLSLLVLVLYGGLLYLTYRGFTETPTGYIPTQDKGFLIVSIQLPDAASAERTREVLADVDRLTRSIPGVSATSGPPVPAGFSAHPCPAPVARCSSIHAAGSSVSSRRGSMPNTRQARWKVSSSERFSSVRWATKSCSNATSKSR